MSTIITTPPRYSATVNCQPTRIHSTRPSSHTRLVEANWKASALAAEAPLTNSERAMATAAYEHDDDAAPRPVARAVAPTPAPPSVFSIRSRGTHAWTTAEMAKPSTSAHHTAHAMSRASRRPCHRKSRNAVIAPSDYTPRG